MSDNEIVKAVSNNPKQFIREFTVNLLFIKITKYVGREIFRRNTEKHEQE